MGLLLARVSVAGVSLIEGARAFKRKRCILERKVFAAIATNVGQKESGSCPTVVVEGVEVCGGRVRCVGVVKVCGTVLEMVACVMCPHAPLWLAVITGHFYVPGACISISS